MAVKTFYKSKDGNQFITEHFQVKEFQCKDGTDKILINTDLVLFLEKLYKYMNAKAINITSGYRTPAHSVRVGGYKTDQHTKGNAADITVKKQDGTLYSSNEICLACDDLNHEGGVGRINKKNSVHIDVRGYKCWFDETNHEKTTNSWYTYLGVKKPVKQEEKPVQVPTQTAATASTYLVATKDKPKFGIDVSEHNGKIDWAKMKDKVAYVIIRVGYGQDGFPEQDDEQFTNNIAGVEKYGIPYGFYLYSYADTNEKAASEADHALRLIKGHKPLLPVYYDLEENNKQAKLSKAKLLEMVKVFQKKITDAGYQFGVYSSTYWWNNYLTDPWYDNYSKWVAHYDVKQCGYKGTYDIWQYGYDTIEGFNGKFDANLLYTSFGIVKGDIDGDGKVTSKDARLALRMATKLTTPNERQLAAGDIDGDGKVGANDARAILKMASKLDK